MKLPRQAGQKEARFAHLLSGEPRVEATAEVSASAPSTRRAHDSDRLTKLEEQVEAIAQQVENLTAQFEQFKKQFE